MNRISRAKVLPFKLTDVLMISTEEFGFLINVTLDFIKNK